MRIPLQEQVLFAKHLAIMVKTGMPILDSLKLLHKQTKSKSMQKILNQVLIDVSNGQFLSASLEKFHKVFGDLFINIVRVGEASGILYENLNYLAEELGKKQALKKKIKGAMIYPSIILVATVGIVVLLTVYVFPKILPIFQSMRIKLPVATRMLIAISSFLTAYGLFVLLAVILAAIGLWLLLKIKSVKFTANQIMLSLPIIGNLTQSYNISNFCRTLGLLLKSDVKVVEAMNITANTTVNPVYRKTLASISLSISKGEEISLHMDKSPRLFPPMVTQMVSIGEHTGNLSETLLYLSNYYEDEVDDATKNLSTILEPILMVFMGLIVGFIAMSIIMPIYQVTQGLQLK